MPAWVFTIDSNLGDVWPEAKLESAGAVPPYVGTLTVMDRPAADPAKLLSHWMEWERGETTPGEIMKQLKLGGLRDLLEAMVEASETPAG